MCVYICTHTHTHTHTLNPNPYPQEERQGRDSEKKASKQKLKDLNPEPLIMWNRGVGGSGHGPYSPAFTPKPETRDPKPETRNRSDLNPRPSTLYHNP
jgi:hypothetical protein